MIYTIIAIVTGSLAATYLTNPFSRFSIIKLPYRVKLQKLSHQAIDQNHKLRSRQNALWRFFAWLQCGMYILSTRYFGQAKSQSKNVDDIIADIHELRFDPNKLLLISGDHFNGLFVRNLGVFYYPMLDANVYYNQQDWHRRQEVYLQTVAYALGVFEKYPNLKTTIISTGRYSATAINFYSYPSDSLYGILYALAALAGEEKSGADLYERGDFSVDTELAARELFANYQNTLKDLYRQYKETVFDNDSMLIKKDIHLSGAKDITKRSSSFYDNVIFWKTTQLAQRLGIISTNEKFLDNLKKNILKTFWNESAGYFIEDLSQESVSQKYYSSDWLIVYATGFLSIKNSKERRYYERSVAHINKNKIARPFAIKYHNDTRAHRQFLAVRLAVASYGGDSIWSFWGMEYIKVNLMLYKNTQENKYLREADYHIKKYQENILKFGGFPEVYDKNGKMLKTIAYKSILMTGWVIGFEQARVMRSLVDKTSND